MTAFLAWITSILEAVGLKWLTLIPGGMGAAVSLKFIEGLTTWQRLSTVLAGAVAAGFLAPLAVEYMELSFKAEPPIAFIIGLFGMSCAGALTKAMPDWLEAAKRKVFGGS